MISNSTTSVPGVDKCGYCGMIHGAKCPTVKSFEYHPDGTVKRVEFFAPNDYAMKLAGYDPNVFPPNLSYAQPAEPRHWSDAYGWHSPGSGWFSPRAEN